MTYGNDLQMIMYDAWQNKEVILVSKKYAFRILGLLYSTQWKEPPIVIIYDHEDTIIDDGIFTNIVAYYPITPGGSMLYRISRRCDSSEFIKTIARRRAILPSGYIPAILVTDQMPNLDNGIFGTMFDVSNIVNLSSRSKEVLPATNFTKITLCSNTPSNITEES